MHVYVRTTYIPCVRSCYPLCNPLDENAYEYRHGVCVKKKCKRSSDPRFHQIWSTCYLLNFQDPAAGNKIPACSACLLEFFQDGAAARHKIFQNIRTTPYVRNFFAEECGKLKDVGSNLLRSRSQDPAARNEIFRNYLPCVRSCDPLVYTSIKARTGSFTEFTHVCIRTYYVPCVRSCLQSVYKRTQAHT